MANSGSGSSSNTKTYITDSGVTYTVTTHNYWLLTAPLQISHAYDVTITAPDGTKIFDADNINRGIDLSIGPLHILQIAASGDVIIGSDDSTTIAQLLSAGNYISVPGSTGNFVIEAGVATANEYYIGGTSKIEGLANLVTGSVINVVGGNATLSGTNGAILAGVLNGSTVNIEYGGTLNTGSALASVLEGTTVNFGAGGGSIIINGGDTLISLLGSGSLNATTFNNYDPSKDTIELQNTTNPIATYTIENGGLFGLDSSQKVIVLKDSSGNTVAEYAVKPAKGVVLDNATYNVNDPTNNPLKVTYKDNNTYIGACFLSGSMIRTTNGEVAVEDVRIGDEVIAFDWRNNTDIVRPVVWVGKAHVNVRHGLADDEAGWPVRILKDAIADGVPYKDMLITAEHCLFFDGKFVPVRMLVNGISIFYDKSITSYDYYHVETDRHSVITADGMLTESYLDTGNRRAFHQEGAVIRLRNARHNWEDDAGAPLCVDRAFVEPLFHKLAARNSCSTSKAISAALIHDPDLHLITESGITLRPLRQDGQHYSFMLPTNTKYVRIISRANRPTDVIGPFMDDRRLMGVAVGDIRLLSAKQQYQITSHLQAEKPDGWHNTEWTDCAWTNGNALLPLEDHLSCANIGILSIILRAAGPFLVNHQNKTDAKQSA